MDLPLNTFKRALHEGRQQIGLWSHLSSHVTVEILANSGFDWLLLDMEHSPNEFTMIHSQLQAMTGGTAHPIVRPPWNDMVLLKRLLDIGVQTFLIPYIENAEQARAAVSYTRYPPHGLRGYSAAPRASGFGRIKDYPKRCEDELCVLVQIETREALDNIEAIAAVDGIDALFIGPGDLSAALGHIGNPKHPEVVAVIEDAIRRIRACGKPVGILSADHTLAQHYIECGCSYIAVGGDLGLLVQASEALAQKFKP